MKGLNDSSLIYIYFLVAAITCEHSVEWLVQSVAEMSKTVDANGDSQVKWIPWQMKHVSRQQAAAALVSRCEIHSMEGGTNRFRSDFPEGRMDGNKFGRWRADVVWLRKYNHSMRPTAIMMLWRLSIYVRIGALCRGRHKCSASWRFRLFIYIYLFRCVASSIFHADWAV